VATLGGREDREKEIWDQLAYAGRYGHQSLDVMLRLSMSQLRKFNAAISAIVHEEMKPRT
jgi:hypothetical protein